MSTCQTSPLNEGRISRSRNPKYSQLWPRDSVTLNRSWTGRSSNSREEGYACDERSSLNEGRPFRAGNPVVLDHSHLVGVQRSTKAGPSGPATLTTRWPAAELIESAQRRPALPGRQPIAPGIAGVVTTAAQRRPALPGRQPPRRLAGPAHPLGRSTKAGPSGPATRDNPADVVDNLKDAQRRPALPGRQPRPASVGERRRDPRSTKAGPSGPATLVKNPRMTTGPYDAQRRPALPGRQPAGEPAEVVAAGLRSTKAGPSGPATLEVPPAARWGARERSTKAGPSGPATRGGLVVCGGVPISAQRRPALPGRQPATAPRTGAARYDAQRRPALPGRQPPRVAGDVIMADVAQRRPALPGRQPQGFGFRGVGVQVAQRRPALPGRQPPTTPTGKGGSSTHRSTKAGPSGPATPLRIRGSPPGRSSLNEGRPFRAGNPRSPGARSSPRPSLNEGRPFRAGNPRTATGCP